ncbi:alpha/beta hydrolase [Streptomyces sp.]|uniref:alpha/beta hydrolase n=1 Tax=Streptomyces sp. TaxID=1931 RepID=UPI002F3F7B19
MGFLTAITLPGATPSVSATGPDLAVQDVPPVRADDGAYVSAIRRLGPNVADLSIESPAMGARMPVRVMLPPGWSPDARRTFPTVYLLQGASDDYTSWTRETDIEELAPQADVIVVTPEGGRAGFYTDWWNYGRKGGPNWETFHTVELPQILERGFRANTRRAVLGLSEGGLGALAYTARHPGQYVFAGSFSGVVDLDDPGLRGGITLTCMREGVDPMRLWGDPEKNRAVWNEHNPARMVNRFRGVKVHLSAAAGLPGPLARNAPVAAGLLEAPAYPPTRAFADRLRAAGVDVTAHLYVTGTHAWPYWERELHLAWRSVLSALRVAR